MEFYNGQDFTENFTTRDCNDKGFLFLLPLKIISFIPALILSTVLFTDILITKNRILNPPEPKPLTDFQKEEFYLRLDALYPERENIISPLPYSAEMNIDTYAKTAILIDMQTGAILWEKNADIKIPPASMTKLVEMYVVFQEIENGTISLDDIVPLPPESWAVNMPPDSSLMFLAQGQTVTLRKLLEGLSIASGNDASHAVAFYVAGTMENFVAKMNSVMQELNLTNTFFVESSGYSEKNITTARDFAQFARIYIQKFPFALKEFHSLEKLEWPPENPVIQYNTNKLLGTLEGCDGLKTGFINESGFNLALTAVRNGRRYLSITMQGPGNSTAEGNRYRIIDGTTLMENAFKNFTDYIPEKKHSYTVGLFASKEKSINLVPAKSEILTIPKSSEQLTINARIPKYLIGRIKQSESYGVITYSQNGRTLYTIPLVADRESHACGAFKRLTGKLTRLIFF